MPFGMRMLFVLVTITFADFNFFVFTDMILKLKNIQRQNETKFNYNQRDFGF